LKNKKLQNTKNKKKGPDVQEDARAIRTRKVRFTGDGFAFPALQTSSPGKPRRTSGRDAILVEGTPGQANMRGTTEGDAVQKDRKMKNTTVADVTRTSKEKTEKKRESRKKYPTGKGKKEKNRRAVIPADHKKSSRETGGPVIECRFSYSGRGFGFAVPVLPDSGVEEDIFISAKSTLGAMTGDLVRVQLIRRGGRHKGDSPEGEVLSILEPAVDAITGTLVITDVYAAVKPDNEKLRILAYVPLEDCAMLGLGDNTKVEIVPEGEPFFTRRHSITIHRRGWEQEIPYFDTRGRIATVFGDAATREANYAAILHASGIRTSFPAYVEKAANEAASQPLTETGRRDLRDQLIFTIDGADAKDLDDAVSIDRTEDGGYILGVHIADVSHYVPYETCVEKEARLRGTSVYFTDKVVPMLPKSLSNDACSLNADTDKYALSCEIRLDKEGNRLATAVYKSILRSKVRGVYTEVNDLFDKGDKSPYSEKYREVYESLCTMRELYGILKKRGEDRGVMELADAEAVILLDDTGFPVEITRRQRGEGEKLIEQFMLQANMAVAELLRAKNLPCLYRTHEEPDKEKLNAFILYAHNLGLPTFGLPDKERTGSALSDALMGILAEAGKRNIGDIVSSVLLRSMMKAKYISQPRGHFGLGAKTYCHFTSPIRRYPDLFVHSVLTAVLPYTPEGVLTEEITLPEEAMPRMLEAAAAERGILSTECEIAAQTAERKIEDLYMALYMSDKIGQIFDVTVCSVLKFGMFVQCDNLVEGMIPVPFFPDAFVNENYCTLRAGGTVYTLGTRMQARLVEADPSTGRITFAPITRNDRESI